MPVNQELERLKEIPFEPSRIETIDTAMYNYLEHDLDLSTTTNKGWTKAPVIWASAERVNQSKRDDRVRDEKGTLILPLITVERTSVVKAPSKKGSVWANILPVRDEKGGAIPVARRINHEKTSNFTNAHSQRKRGQINFPINANRVVYETISIPLPVYVTVTYQVTLRTEYQQQMNDLMVPFATTPGGINYILVNSGAHRYEGFIQENFQHSNNFASFTNEERKLETVINIEVLGYLIGQDKNQEQPKLSYRENAVEVKIPRERIAFADEVESKKGRYYGLPGFDEEKKR
jgi:hypothetical protein